MRNSNAALDSYLQQRQPRTPPPAPSKYGKQRAQLSQNLVDAAMGERDEQGGMPSTVANTLIHSAGMAGEYVGDNLWEPIADTVLSGISWAIGDDATQYVKEGMADLAKGAMDTQAVQTMFSWAEANPQKAGELSALFKSADLLPFRALSGDAFNQMFQEVITKLDGFYAGHQLGATLKAAATGTPNYLKRQFTPQGQANARVKGMGQSRVDEAVGSIKNSATDRAGSKNASGAMAQQMDNKGTMAEGPTFTGENVVTTPWGNKLKVREGLVGTNNPDDIPDNVLDYFEKHIEEGLGPESMKTNWASPKSIGVTQVLPRITNAVTPKPSANKALANFRDPSAPHTNLQVEQLGNVSASSATTRFIRKGQMENYAKTLGLDSVDALDEKQLLDFFRLSKAFELDQFNPAIRGKGPGLIGALNEAGAALKKPAVFYRRGIKHTPREEGKKRTLQELKDNLYVRKHGPVKEVKASHTALLNAYFGAKKAKNPTDRQRVLVDTIDDYVANKVPKTEDFVSYGEGSGLAPGQYGIKAGHLSVAKELGGVGDLLVIDTNKKEMFSVIFDGHDMANTLPAGGKDFWNITQVQKMPMGEGRVDMVNAADSPSHLARVQDGLENIKKITGQSPRAVKETQEQFLARMAAAGHTRRTGETLADFKKRVGQDYLGVEDPYKFESRMLRDFTPKPIAADYANVLANGLFATAGFNPFNNNE